MGKIEKIKVDFSKNATHFISDDVGKVEIRIRRVKPINMFSKMSDLCYDLENWFELIKDQLDEEQYEEYKEKIDELTYIITYVSESFNGV